MAEEESNIVAIVKWEGVTESIYEKIREEVDFEEDVPEGMVIHIASFDKKGLRVTDVWESEDNFNNFIKNRLTPVTKKLVKTEPDVEIYPLENLFIP